MSARKNPDDQETQLALRDGRVESEVFVRFKESGLPALIAKYQPGTAQPSARWPEPAELTDIFSKRGCDWDVCDEPVTSGELIQLKRLLGEGSGRPAALALLEHRPALANHREIIPLVLQAALDPHCGSSFKRLATLRYPEREAVLKWIFSKPQIARLLAIGKKVLRDEARAEDALQSFSYPTTTRAARAKPLSSTSNAKTPAAGARFEAYLRVCWLLFCIGERKPSSERRLREELLADESATYLVDEPEFRSRIQPSATPAVLLQDVLSTLLGLRALDQLVAPLRADWLTDLFSRHPDLANELLRIDSLGSVVTAQGLIQVANWRREPGANRAITPAEWASLLRLFSAPNWDP